MYVIKPSILELHKIYLHSSTTLVDMATLPQSRGVSLRPIVGSRASSAVSRGFRDD